MANPPSLLTLPYTVTFFALYGFVVHHGGLVRISKIKNQKHFPGLYKGGVHICRQVNSNQFYCSQLSEK